AGDGLAEAACVDDLAVLDHADGDARQVVAFDGGLDGGVEHGIDAGGGGTVAGDGSRGCRRSHHQAQCEREQPLHGGYSVAVAAAAATSMTCCQTLRMLPPQIFAMSASLK